MYHDSALTPNTPFLLGCNNLFFPRSTPKWNIQAMEFILHFLSLNSSEMNRKIQKKVFYLSFGASLIDLLVHGAERKSKWRTRVLFLTNYFIITN